MAKAHRYQNLHDKKDNCFHLNIHNPRQNYQDYHKYQYNYQHKYRRHNRSWERNNNTNL